MKDSGIEWIGQIPQNWEVVRLKYIADIFNGNSISDTAKDKYENSANAIPYISTKDINLDFNTINYDNGLFIQKNDINFKVAPKNSALLCIEGGSAGKKLAFTNQNVCFVNKLCCFYSQNFDSKFLYYFLQSSAFQTEFFLRLSGLIGGVSINNIKNFKIPFPPLDEQRKISEFLDIKCGEIDDLRKGIKEKIANLKAYKSSLITKAVTGKLAISNEKLAMKDSGISWIGEIPQNWEVSKIKYCFSFSSGLNITKENLVENGIPVISYGQIHSKLNNGTSIKDELLRFVSEEYLKNKKSLVKIGDFIIADTSEDLDGVGNFVFIDRDCLLFAGYHTIVLQNNKNFIFGKFLSYLFQTDIYRSQLRLLVSGIKVFSITKKILADCKILVPPLEEQKRISEFLDNKCKIIDDLIANLNKQDEVLSEYKKSLIYECVTGKLAMSN